jgi:hypothetical protein
MLQVMATDQSAVERLEPRVKLSSISISEPSVRLRLGKIVSSPKILLFLTKHISNTSVLTLARKQTRSISFEVLVAFRWWPSLAEKCKGPILLLKEHCSISWNSILILLTCYTVQGPGNTSIIKVWVHYFGYEAPTIVITTSASFGP